MSGGRGQVSNHRQVFKVNGRHNNGTELAVFTNKVTRQSVIAITHKHIYNMAPKMKLEHKNTNKTTYKMAVANKMVNKAGEFR